MPVIKLSIDNALFRKIQEFINLGRTQAANFSSMEGEISPSFSAEVLIEASLTSDQKLAEFPKANQRGPNY